MSLFVCRTQKRRPPAEEHRSAPRHRRAVLLVNTGTPDSPNAASVRRYLTEFLSDPLVIRLPRGLGWLQGVLGRLLARFRAPGSAEKYRRIWTERGSPLKVIMEDQAAALASVLPEGWKVYVGMRYGQPRMAEVLARINDAGIEELVIVPVYPQFSRTTTGTVIREAYRVLNHVGQHLNVAARTCWYHDGGYLNAQARLIAEYARRHGLTPQDTHLVFSAHGLPVSYVKRGDPYPGQVERSAKLVAQRLGWPADRLSLAYHSRLGPTEWLKPDLKDVLRRLAEAGQGKVLVCPISFSVDCLETLEEIDRRCRAQFEAHGGQLYLCPALNDYGPFIGALKNLVLRGPQPVTSWGGEVKPLLAGGPQSGLSRSEAADGDLGSLVMIGVSLENRVGPGRGPGLRYSEAGALSSVRKPHDDVLTLLRTVRDDGSAREGLIWNTCHRFELYGWLEKPPDRDCVVARLRGQLFGSEPAGLAVNVLFGQDAWHHLVRTGAGLNSGLPGDADVVEQLEAAHRVANGAGTCGPWLTRLLAEAVATVRAVRRETEWGRHEPGYCSAAISRIDQTAGLHLPECRHVVIGGSTTSCSVLGTLRERFKVSPWQMTLIHRSHRGGQIKMLRKAIGHGRRVRAQSYTERAVIEEIAEADVVYFGIDSDVPVLNADNLREVRDFVERPLTVIDFNTFGSTEGLEAIDGVTVWHAARLEEEVAAYAEAMSAGQDFAAALDEAETWIAEHAPQPVATRLDMPCIQGQEVTHPCCTGCRVKAAQAMVGSAGR